MVNPILSPIANLPRQKVWRKCCSAAGPAAAAGPSVLGRAVPITMMLTESATLVRFASNGG